MGLCQQWGIAQRPFILGSKGKSSCDKIVVSIFVNPTQFNNQNDLKNYPIKLEEDLQLLKENKVDMVFVPSSIDEVYNNENPVVFDLDKIDKVMEGAPGLVILKE